MRSKALKVPYVAQIDRVNKSMDKYNLTQLKINAYESDAEKFRQYCKDNGISQRDLFQKFLNKL